MCNIIINTFYIIYVKSIDNDVTHRKIFTIVNILAIFIFIFSAFKCFCYTGKFLCIRNYILAFCGGHIVDDPLSMKGLQDW